MKILSFFTLILTCQLAFAQVNIDSLESKIPQRPELPDSLRQQWEKIDSIRNSFNHSADSLQRSFQKSITSITEQSNRINSKIDSLENLQLPTSKLTSKIDSLNQVKEKQIAELNGKMDKLKAKTIGKLDKVEMTPGMEGPVGEFKNKINGFALNGDPLPGIPAIEIPGYSLPKLENAGDLTSNIGQVTNIAGLPQIDTPLGDVGQVTGQLKGVSEDVKNISQGNLRDVKDIPQVIEQQASNIEGVQELQKQSGVLDQYKEQITNMNDPEALKKQAEALVRKEAVNHFAGKEEQLRAAMDKISKYKQKYSSVPSIKDLPKRPPNAMKDKPLIERLVPGIYFQFQQRNAWLLDVNPYLGYRLSGRIFAGLGWNQRFAYDRKIEQFVAGYRIFGPRAFVDVTLGKGFIAHTEAEVMNTFVPSSHRTFPETGSRQWAWSAQMGLKKRYKIHGNLYGTVLLQYNFINEYFKTPYSDRLNSRIGFEYSLKQKRNRDD